MKIIMSPAKTQNFSGEYSENTTTPHFNDVAQSLREQVVDLSVEELMKLYKIKEAAANKLYELYHNRDILPQQSLYTYTGIVFQYMDVNNWNENMIKYAENHLFILDAMYGVLRTTDGILPYRLDMMQNSIAPKGSLKKLWMPLLHSYFQDEKMIINLASKEFSNLLDQSKLLTISFVDKKDGAFKRINTFVKMARGAFVQEIIRREINKPEELRTINVLNYAYNEKLSSPNEYVYARDEKKE